MSFTILAVLKRPGRLTTIQSQFPDRERMGTSTCLHCVTFNLSLLLNCL